VKAAPFPDSGVFLVRYPTFGLWALSLIIQATLYWLFLPLMFYKIIVEPTDGEFGISRNTRVIYLAVVLAICALIFITFVFGTGDDKQIVRPELFMDNLNIAFGYVNILGYLVAGVCLTGMLFCMIGAGSEAAGANAGNYKAVKANLDTIRGRFNQYFLITAIILSLAVFTTGQFFSALNTLDFMKVYNRSIGFEYFRNETVYLYAILHSFLLLLFYLPVHMGIAEAYGKVNGFAAALPAATAAVTADSKKEVATSDPGTSLLRKFLDLFVVGSPLIAAFLKSLLDIAFG
jgi:hypothetical protein